jgi:hypothetical protein
LGSPASGFAPAPPTLLQAVSSKSIISSIGTKILICWISFACLLASAKTLQPESGA